MKKSLILTIIIIIILAALSVFLYIKMLQYKKVIDYHFPVPEEMVALDGKINKIQASVLIIETVVQDPYTIPDKWKSKTIKVTVTDETEIIKHGMETFKEIAFYELKVEDEIIVRAEENIMNKNEFTAKSIEVYYSPEAE